ncbi:hypothetical protein [Streptomyces hoynatensis]|uniref:DUF3887 domain-containing protein n=1 Tax=Streptomyces hoynatensis TaxID=1141874 RepID=A0A3A9Z0E0_9ACTN|nr:hypothetical protein [Streptomyces hoynatensis]RKN41630.1 hypothetical protein D7294_14140 [Streptomyces hoynatensis]
MFESRIFKKAALVVGGAAVALPLLAAAPAVAAPSGAGAEQVAAARQAAPNSFVLGFYQDYSEAVRANDQTLAEQLLTDNLTETARDEVAAWEAENGADGVLFAQNAPEDVTILDTDGAAGTIYYTLGLEWGDGSTTPVTVKYSNVVGLISGISNQTA